MPTPDRELTCPTDRPRRDAVEDSPMPIQIKRVYDPPARSDGKRILVDRLWPRGLSKEKAKIDLWLRDIAPSNELRKWYQHDPEKWAEFRKRYFVELKAQTEAVNALTAAIEKGTTTLLFSSKELKFNNATALKAYLEK
jgi:uncharacterized protein YeaO (DUF488 family)